MDIKSFKILKNFKMQNFQFLVTTILQVITILILAGLLDRERKNNKND